MSVSADDPLPPDPLYGGNAIALDVERLYRAQQLRLSRYFARRASPDDVADLVHETFSRLIGRLLEARDPLDCPEAWLHRAANNLLLDRSRRARFRGDHDEFDEDTIGGIDPLAALEARDEVARVDAALLDLPELTREIFLLHRLGGHSYAEIGAARGMSVRKVEKQIVKALLLLRQRLRPSE
jgi:RNA polymerase sigma-70 factor (ECF subfamily)